jgi:prevent-host-death family protein
MTADTWTIAEATTRLGELIALAQSRRPQMITSDGQTVAVIVAADEWRRKATRKGSLADFFAASPLRNSQLAIERRKERPRR